MIAEINIWGEKIIIIIKKSGLLIISLLVCSAFRRNPNFLFTQKPRFLLFGEDFAGVPISPGVLASAGARAASCKERKRRRRRKPRVGLSRVWAAGEPGGQKIVLFG